MLPLCPSSYPSASFNFSFSGPSNHQSSCSLQTSTSNNDSSSSSSSSSSSFSSSSSYLNQSSSSTGNLNQTADLVNSVVIGSNDTSLSPEILLLNLAKTVSSSSSSSSSSPINASKPIQKKRKHDDLAENDSAEQLKMMTTFYEKAQSDMNELNKEKLELELKNRQLSLQVKSLQTENQKQRDLAASILDMRLQACDKDYKKLKLENVELIKNVVALVKCNVGLEGEIKKSNVAFEKVSEQQQLLNMNFVKLKIDYSLLALSAQKITNRLSDSSSNNQSIFSPPNQPIPDRPSSRQSVGNLSLQQFQNDDNEVDAPSDQADSSRAYLASSSNARSNVSNSPHYIRNVAPIQNSSRQNFYPSANSPQYISNSVLSPHLSSQNFYPASNSPQYARNIALVQQSNVQNSHPSANCLSSSSSSALHSQNNARHQPNFQNSQSNFHQSSSSPSTHSNASRHLLNELERNLGFSQVLQNNPDSSYQTHNSISVPNMQGARNFVNLTNSQFSQTNQNALSLFSNIPGPTRSSTAPYTRAPYTRAP